MANDPRLAAQLLASNPAPSAVAVVDHLLAVQAQDLAGARLAIRARTRGLGTSDVDAMLEAREAVVATLNRGTLHLVTPESYWLLQRLTTPQLMTAIMGRLAQEGVPASDVPGALKAVRLVLADGPLGRKALRDGLTRKGIRTEGQAFIQIVGRASLEGLIVRGPMLGNEHGFVLTDDWLGTAPKAASEDAALAELGRRYLLAHGPAQPEDLAKWGGVTLGAARRAFERCGNVSLAEGGRVVPKLLGQWDELLMGWASREPVLGSHTEIVTMNGIFKPFPMVAGKAVGTWTRPRGKVAIEYFDDVAVSAAAKAALEKDAADVERFFAS